MVSGLTEQPHKMWLTLSQITSSSPGTAPPNLESQNHRTIQQHRLERMPEDHLVQPFMRKGAWIRLSSNPTTS